MKTITTAILICLLASALQSTAALAGNKKGKAKKAKKEASRFLEASEIAPEQGIINYYSYATLKSPKLVYLGPGNQEKLSIRRIDKKVAEAAAIVPGERLRIDEVAKDFELSRLEALEVQAILRRYFKSDAISDDDFLRAISVVKNGRSMSGAKKDVLEKAPFILALDADLTIWDQETSKYFEKNVHSHSFADSKGMTVPVALAPGYETLIRKARQLGGAVVIYSRNTDELIHAIAEAVQLDGKPLRDSLDAILTSSHMVMPSDEQIERASEKEGMFELRKDLSVLGLEKTIIVDDNPKYVLQKDRVRKVTPFEAEKLVPYTPLFADSSSSRGVLSSSDYKSKFGVDFETGADKKEMDKSKPRKDEDVEEYRRHIKGQFEVVAAEIEEALAYSRAAKISFAEAFYIYTAAAEDVVTTIMDTNKKFENPLDKKYSRKEARELLRRDPSKIEYILKKRKKIEEPSLSPLGYGKYPKDEYRSSCTKSMFRGSINGDYD